VKRLRILLADDHEVVRRGIRSILEMQPGWEICGEASTGRQAVEEARRVKPDVLVMDITMPELNGLEATRQVLKELPQTQVLVLSVHESEHLLLEVLQSGARGYVLKSDAGRDLVAGVEALSRGRPYFTARSAALLVSGCAGNEPLRDPDVPHLTAREKEVLQLLAEGHTNRVVAERLKISAKTVETHRCHIMAKLGLPSFADLVRYAMRNGFSP
jgi:DNA-binding NarL/FixJ family response regulator